jgi:hypothetical protein
MFNINAQPHPQPTPASLSYVVYLLSYCFVFPRDLEIPARWVGLRKLGNPLRLTPLRPAATKIFLK